MATTGISTNLGNLDEDNFNLKIDNGDLDFLYKKKYLMCFETTNFTNLIFKLFCLIPHEHQVMKTVYTLSESRSLYSRLSA